MSSKLRLNVGSGQRPFAREHGWLNVDCVSRPPDQVPDLICDVGKEPLPFPEGSAEVVVLHHLFEHFGLNEGDGLLRECYRVLSPGGSLIVTVPDLRQLATKWLAGGIDDYIFMVNVYGAYQGLESDRHKWGYDQDRLIRHLQSKTETPWSKVVPFDWRAIPGADVARDWWIAGVEAVK